MIRNLFRLCTGALLVAALIPAAVRADDLDDDREPIERCASGASEIGAQSYGYSLKSTLRIVGLTADGQLVCFSDKRPHRVRMVGAINDLHGDTRLLAIDFRAQDGLLYGLGDAGGVYRVDTANALVAPVGRLTVALTGSSTTIDFNPAANALRIIGNDGQNLRQSFAAMPLAATAIDGALNFTATATPGPTAAGIAGAAYTNNDLDARTATTLFVPDAAADRIALQSPANSGFLVATGSLGVEAVAPAGSDIYSVLRENVSVAQRALAALSVAGVVGLYDVDLLTGSARLRGAIGSVSPVVSIAIPHHQF